jgi:hypothetical protein
MAAGRLPHLTQGGMPMRAAVERATARPFNGTAEKKPPNAEGLRPVTSPEME